MKKNMRRVMTATLICSAVLAVASCDNKDNIEDKETEQALWDDGYDFDFPYSVYVSPGAAAEFQEAFGDFIVKPAATIDENTYLVILDKPGDLPAERLVELYGKGVIIAFAHPKKAEIESLYKEYPELGYYLDNDEIDNALLLAISGWNNGIFIIPDPAKYQEEELSEVPDDRLAFPAPEHDLSYCYFEMFFQELMRQQALYEETLSDTKAQTKSGDQNADIKKVTGRIPVWATGVVNVDRDFFRGLHYQGRCPISVSYDIYPLHVYEGEMGNGDYYFVNMTANVNNAEMYKGKKRKYETSILLYVRRCGAYATDLLVRSTLINNDNEQPVSTVMFPAGGFPIPGTVIKKTNYEEKSSFNIGCGISGNLGGKEGKGMSGGGNLSVNTGWSWSDTKSWTVEDVDVTNQTESATAAWKLVYNELPRYHWPSDCGFDEGRSLSYRSSMQVRGSWVWHIPNVPDDSESKQMRIKIEVKATYGFMNFWGSKADMDTHSWDCNFTSIQPMPRIANYTAGNLILKNDTDKFISNIMVYDKDGNALVPRTQFQGSNPAGREIRLGAFKCCEDLIVKFVMDGKTYVYSLNKYAKTVFKEDVWLYASHDFTVENNG